MSIADGSIGGVPARFTKMSGAGNDFLVFPRRVDVGPREAETIRAICRRGLGVGADGVLFVVAEPGSPGRVRLDYHNADGSRARFCANGTRCAARFAKERGGAPAEMVVATDWGDIGATVREDGSVTLRLPEPVALGERVDSYVADGRFLEPEAQALSIGVPHLVVFTASDVAVETLDLAALAPPLRRHRDLPDGANVSFVTARGPSRLAVRSWERGVEAETLSCGGGVVAAAVVAAVRRGEAPPISVATRAGVALGVDFRVEGGRAVDVTLTGDARFVFEGTLSQEAL